MLIITSHLFCDVLSMKFNFKDSGILISDRFPFWSPFWLKKDSANSQNPGHSPFVMGKS